MSDGSPRFRWPAGHRAALSVIVHVVGAGLHGDTLRQPGLVGVDYTATGLQRLLVTLADLDVTATVAFTNEAANGTPQLLRRAAEMGHEVAASACSETGSIAELLVTVRSITGVSVNGLVEQLPGLASLDQDDDVGNDSVTAWRIAGVSGDFPSTIGGQGPVVIPVSPYLVDLTWLSPARPLPPSSMLEAWSLAIAGHRADNSYMSIVLHPHITGRPELVGTVTRFLDEVIATGDVWIARLDDVSRAWQESKREPRE